MAEFRDRFDAGRRLALSLAGHANRSGVLVLALPRGGVPVGLMVAEALNAPLHLYPIRKLGVPGREELALGAIAGGGVRILNEEVVKAFAIPPETIESLARREEEELRRQEQIYRREGLPPDLSGRTVIIVDDGLATGSSMKAAARALRAQGPDRVVAAVPLASSQALSEVAEEVDEIVCLVTPEPFVAVGMGYGDFCQLSDEEVRELLETGTSAGEVRR